MVKEKVEVSDKVLAYGGFGGVRPGKYKGIDVAVKTARVATRDNLQKIRKVSINFGHPGRSSQPFCPSGFTGKPRSGAHCRILTS